VLTSTDLVGSLAGIPVVAQAVNAVNKMKPVRRAMESVAEIHADAWLPEFHGKPLRSRLTRKTWQVAGEPAGRTRGKVALFATCYMNRNEPGIGEDFAAVYEHNGIPVTLAEKERCCGMPKLELGDLEAVIAAKEVNIPQLARLVDEGWDLTALIPSCVLMFKQELPLMFPDDADVQKVKNAFFDPFEYLMLRHKEGKLKTDFKTSLGKVAYHAACHQRVQNIGQKTREALALVPDTVVDVIERCSGHDGTYAVKKESHVRDEDRQTGGHPRAAGQGRPLRQRLRDGRAPHRERDEGWPRAGTSDDLAAQGLRHLIVIDATTSQATKRANNARQRWLSR
jgi:glycerol-3-phosphate dehydrogenase subunit C